jgi:hypothetical protein
VRLFSLALSCEALVWCHFFFCFLFSEINSKISFG